MEGVTVDTERGVGAPASERAVRLTTLREASSVCERCPQLVASRTQVVFGAGDPDADVLFIGEAPGAREDESGVPFSGASGGLLDELLAVAGVTRGEVFVTNVLKCRPPGNRDPASAEIERCRPYLEEQIALVRPRVVCTLGNFATRLMRAGPEGISEIHGRDEIITVAGHSMRLLPLYHPAAALYTRALLERLQADIARIPELVARPAPPQPVPTPAPTPEPELPVAPASPEAGAAEPVVADSSGPDRAAPGDGQLGLF